MKKKQINFKKIDVPEYFMKDIRRHSDVWFKICSDLYIIGNELSRELLTKIRDDYIKR